MLRRLMICALASACAFALGTVFVSNAQGPTGEVEVTVSVEAVGISITGGDVAFGGPYEPNAQLAAHPNAPSAEFVAKAVPPIVKNTGNVPLTSLVVTYSGPAQGEASCDGGASAWPARVTANPSGFLMRALGASSDSWTTFSNNWSPIQPGTTGSGNVLLSGLNPGAEAKLFLYLRIPQAPAGGGSGCTIGLIVTATAG